MEEIYDIAFVGAGISTAYTLWHYLLLLVRQPLAVPVRIIVFEKSGEFWTGVPYGKLSGRAALLISSLKEFMPQEPERADFKAWLNDHRRNLWDKSGEPPGQLSARWWRDHAEAIAAGEWDDLFLPRYLVGCYLQERMAALLADAVTKGLIVYQLSPSAVTDIECVGERHRLVTDAAESPHIIARQVILAIGSPPYSAPAQLPSDVAASETCFINNTYEPSLDANLRRIGERLTPSGGDGVLIIGSNASALETLYHLANSAQAMSRIGKIIILSPDAAFPHRISGASTASDYPLVHLDALLESASLASRDILAAVEQDVAGAMAAGLNIADLYHEISRRVILALGRLDRGEQEKFVAVHGVEIGKLQRRAGSEYLDVAQGLIAQGRLELHKGRFVKCLTRDEGGPGCSYLEGRAGGPKILLAPISVVVSCAGFQDVAKSSSVLMQNLLRRGVCAPNASKRGFALNADYEASPGCHVMGPLVAGNILGTFKVWHAESCTRIIHMSKHLAEILIREQRPLRPAPKTRRSRPGNEKGSRHPHCQTSNR